jgi:ADP-heptose:LPS heptosyltransferase
VHHLTLIKLAAIGDVTLAAQALQTVVRQSGDSWKVDWIIDRKLEPLAQSLLSDSVLSRKLTITFHPIDAGRLFTGGAVEKIRESLHLSLLITKLQPKHILLLHRDWRYFALLRPVFSGKFSMLKRKPAHEFDTYVRALEDTLSDESSRKFGEELGTSAEDRPAPSKRIGILIGGAQNQKVTFEEKRWPHFKELIETLSSRYNGTIELFGGREDVSNAAGILKQLPISAKIVNRTGDVPLEKIPQELANLDAFVSIDSGLAHIAASVMRASHQKVVTLFGPTDPKIWAPRATGQGQAVTLYKAKACSPCYSNDGSFKPCRFEGQYFKHCMTDISVDEVLRALEI